MNKEEKEIIEKIQQDSTFRERNLLRIIEKQQAEIEKQDKIIGKMIDNIMTHYQVKTIRKMCCPTCIIGEKACTYSGIHRNCIKQYFERKIEQ